MAKRITRNKAPLTAPPRSEGERREQTIEERTADLRLRAAKARVEDAAKIARGLDAPKKAR
jgi:hypothetical protein